MFGLPAYMPCPDCGASVPRDELAKHECSLERTLDYQLFQLRDDLASLEAEITVWLASPEGQFDQFYAESRRTQ